jgi:hypothetical protein
MLDTREEFEKEFPKLNHARSPDTQRYLSRVTAVWYTGFLMYKMQEAETTTLKAELALLRDALEAYSNGP